MAHGRGIIGYGQNKEEYDMKLQYQFSGLIVFFVTIFLCGSVSADCPSPMNIVYGDYTICEISQAGEVDMFHFPGSAGDRIRLQVTDSNDSWAWGVNPRVEVYDPSEALLYSGSTDSVYLLRPDEALTSTGQYKVLVWGDVGTYALSLERLSDPFGPEVKYDEHVGDDIASFGEVDLFTFFGCEGDSIRLQVTDSNDSWAWGINPIVKIFDHSGNLFASANGNGIVVLQPTLPAEGIYSILIRGATGAYSFDHDILFGGACIPYGNVQADVLLNSTTFGPGDLLDASVRITNGSDPASVDAKVWVALPDGELMSLVDLGNLPIAPSTDQTHGIIIYTFNGSEQSGTYWVGAHLTDPVSGKTVTLDQEQFTFTP